MGGLLADLTLYTTFACMGLTLWFAVYLLSRSRANPVAFRAIVALVAMAFYYNNVLNALISGQTVKSPVRLLAQTIALIAWHDLTIYLLSPEQRRKRYTLARGVVLFGVIIFVLIFTAPPAQPCDPEYSCPTSLSYPSLIVALFIAVVFCLTLYNLWLIMKAGGLRLNMIFYLAILVGVGPAFPGIFGTLLNVNIPRLIPNLVILVALILLIYSVARERTLVAHHTSTYDLPITMTTIMVILIIYVLVGRQLNLSQTNLVLVAALVVLTHSAYDFVRDFLDRLFHRQERQVRRELDSLGREVTTAKSLENFLSRGLAILCKNLNASCGFIATRQKDQYIVVASLLSLPVGEPIPSKEINLEGLAEPNSLIFPNIAWLAPGYAGNEHCALIGLGARKDKVPYDEDDLYWLEDIAHELGEIIHSKVQLESAPIRETGVKGAVPGTEASPSTDHGGLLSVLAYKPDQQMVECIEDGYQHINDFDALGGSPLVELFGIKATDHLESGRQVHDRLIQILEKLRPIGQPPPEPLPREWYAYTILHDSYVKDCLSRDIMGKLYIGEGTYYRLRRQALRGITRAVVEMGVSA